MPPFLIKLSKGVEFYHLKKAPSVAIYREKSTPITIGWP